LTIKSQAGQRQERDEHTTFFYYGARAGVRGAATPHRLNRSQKTGGGHMSSLIEKVALVTGGSRGIGAAIAKRLAADGASVAITYAKDAKAASAVVNAIKRDGGAAVAIQANATDVAAVKVRSKRP
jgi:3-oxoacyl-ACP reductase-like protein